MADRGRAVAEKGPTELRQHRDETPYDHLAADIIRTDITHAALLRFGIAERGRPTDGIGQIARASSVNAATIRLVPGVSTASS
jgi:hypothetical protein